MRLWRHLGAVRAAQAQAVARRAELAAPAAALLARWRRHPLTALGIAGGVGLLLGALGLRLPRMAGWSSLLRGGLAEALAQGIRLATAPGAGDDNRA